MKRTLSLVLAACVAPLWAQEVRFFRIAGPEPTVITSAAADGTVTWTNVATNTTFTVQVATGLQAHPGWADYVRVPASNSVTVQRIFDPNPPPGTVLIPAGAFIMGDAIDDNGAAFPLHTVYVSAFYMEANSVTHALWTNVYQWATNHGYSFNNAGHGKAADHPVQTVSWYDAVKWCNARSQMAGLAPCYYEDSSLTAPYKTGQVAPYVNWGTNGYRLPTEAEWEKAARGGAAGHRFPWTDTDTIDWSRANYCSDLGGGHPYWPYDVNPTSGYNTNFTTGDPPYTSPVGFFAANGYGLYDMAGNACVWCWDWYDPDWYSKAEAVQDDTQGPASSPFGYRVLRGGGWSWIAPGVRCANRSGWYPDNGISDDRGLRCARRP